MTTDTCGVCSGPSNDDMVFCDHCNRWFDFECVGLSKEEIDRIEYFYCHVCEDLDELNLTTTWKGRKPTAAQRADKRKNYFEVESISANKIKRVGRVVSRLFKIKWKGFSDSESTWEPEYHLDGCIDVLQRYLRENGLPLSNIESLLGGSHSSKFNMKNWCKMDNIISTYLRFKRYRFQNVDLQIEKFDKFRPHDSLYFLDLDSHCFVILHFAEQNFAWIADGGNFFLNDARVAKSVRELLGVRLTACKFEHYTRTDYCGSSGVLIALEFTRAYRTKVKPKVLSCPSSWRDRIIKHMHKHKSSLVELQPLHLRKSTFKCKFCQRSFGCNRRKCVSHMAKCNKSK